MAVGRFLLLSSSSLTFPLRPLAVRRPLSVIPKIREGRTKNHLKTRPNKRHVIQQPSPPFMNDMSFGRSINLLSSNNPLSNSTNNKIVFFPFIISKDFYGKILILYLYLLQIHFGFSSFSHPDNALEACGLLTPLHIVPEWYFLCQYAMLKAVPNKNAGFIILFTSIFILFYFMRSLSISFYFIIFFTNRFNGFYLCFWFLLHFSFIWIGGQFPVDNFLSYGRILTLHYYYLLICILLALGVWVCHSRPRDKTTETEKE